MPSEPQRRVEAGVDELVDTARRAGAVVVTSPGWQPWGYTAVFTDPDFHLWMVEAQSFMAPATPMSRAAEAGFVGKFRGGET